MLHLCVLILLNKLWLKSRWWLERKKLSAIVVETLINLIHSSLTILSFLLICKTKFKNNIVQNEKLEKITCDVSRHDGGPPTSEKMESDRIVSACLFYESYSCRRGRRELLFWDVRVYWTPRVRDFNNNVCYLARASRAHRRTTALLRLPILWSLDKAFCSYFFSFVFCWYGV